MIEETVTIRDDRTTLVGFLEIPSTPAGIVLSPWERERPI
jgi:hypothetical protein